MPHWYVRNHFEGCTLRVACAFVVLPIATYCLRHPGGVHTACKLCKTNKTIKIKKLLKIIKEICTTKATHRAR